MLAPRIASVKSARITVWLLITGATDLVVKVGFGSGDETVPAALVASSRARYPVPGTSPSASASTATGPEPEPGLEAQGPPVAPAKPLAPKWVSVTTWNSQTAAKPSGLTSPL